jgi:hypothetical protein
MDFSGHGLVLGFIEIFHTENKSLTDQNTVASVVGQMIRKARHDGGLTPQGR